jgi:DNA invertase Pin-like site-specific DNA recombinase
VPSILAYVRASTNRQETDLQLAMLDREGYDELFTEHISGRRRDRPEFQRMVDRALELRRQGHEVAILVVNGSRWARDIVTSLTEIERLEEAGVTIRSIEGGKLSVATPEDFMVTGVSALASEFFSRNLSREVKRRYNEKRLAGKVVGSRVAWPYRRRKDDFHQLEPDPEQWPIARQLIERLAAGETFGAAVKWLDSQGVRRSIPWAKKWLNNPVLRGHLAYSIGGLTSADRRAGVKKPQHLIYNTHPALVSEAEWQLLRYRIELRRSLHGANAGATVYPVPPIVWCAACGGKASSALADGRRYWRCTHYYCPGTKPSTRDDAIEAAMQEAILEAAEAVAAAVLCNDTTDPRIAALEAEAVALRPLSHRAGIVAEIEAIELEVAQLKAAQGTQAAGAAELRKALLGLAVAPWEALTPEQRRGIYGRFVERVAVVDGEVVEVVVRGV